MIFTCTGRQRKLYDLLCYTVFYFSGLEGNLQYLQGMPVVTYQKPQVHLATFPRIHLYAELFSCWIFLLCNLTPISNLIFHVPKPKYSTLELYRAVHISPLYFCAFAPVETHSVSIAYLNPNYPVKLPNILT